MVQELAIPPGYGQPGDSYELPTSDGVPTSSPEPKPGSRAQPPPSDISAANASREVAWKNEDRTSFNDSDLSINVTLFREDGHPDGRLVQVTIHNFGETRASTSFRAPVPTQESFLNWLQANSSMDLLLQQYWLQLEEQRKKAAQAPARAPRISAPALAGPAATPAAQPGSRPAASPQAPRSQPEQASAPSSPAQLQPVQTQFEFF